MREGRWKRRSFYFAAIAVPSDSGYNQIVGMFIDLDPDGHYSPFFWESPATAITGLFLCAIVVYNGFACIRALLTDAVGA